MCIRDRSALPCRTVPKWRPKRAKPHLKTVGAPLLLLQAITQVGMLTLDSPAPISIRQHTPRNTKPRTHTAPLQSTPCTLVLWAGDGSALPWRTDPKWRPKRAKPHLKTVSAPLLQLQAFIKSSMLTLDSPAPISIRQHTPNNTKPRTHTAPLRVDTVHACAPGRRRVCIAVPG